MAPHISAPLSDGPPTWPPTPLRRSLLKAAALLILAFLLMTLDGAPLRAQTGDPSSPVEPAPTPIDCVPLPPGAIVDPPVVLQVALPTVERLRTIAAEHDVWLARPREGYAIVGGSLRTVLDLQAQGYEVVVDVARSAQVAEAAARIRNQRDATCPDADEAALVNPASTSAHSEVPGIVGFPCYRSGNEINEALYALAAAYPTLARVVDIGDSWERVTPDGAAGHDILALQVTNSLRVEPKFPFVLMAAIHARELSTGEVALRFAEDLLANYGRDPEATWLLDHGVLHLLPMVNPDGREYAEAGLLWRKNTHFDAFCSPPGGSRSFGVDLNRNSSFQWNACTLGDCSSSDACSITYRGASAASEPETVAIESYLRGVLSDQRGPDLADAAPDTTRGLFVSLHSFGELVLHPWSFTDAPPPNSTGLATIGSRFTAISDYRSCQTGSPDCLYGADGTTDDWVYGTFGVPAYTIEIGLSFFESCTSFEQTIRQPMHDLLRYAYSIADMPYQLALGPTVNIEMPNGSVAQVNSAESQWEEFPVQVGRAFTLTATLRIGGPTLVGDAPSARWWLDQDPAIGGPLVPVPGSGGLSEELVLVQAEIDPNGWPPGRSLLMVQASDAHGSKGPPDAIFVNVEPQQAEPPPPTVVPPPAPPRESVPVRVFLPIAGVARSR